MKHLADQSQEKAKDMAERQDASGDAEVSEGASGTVRPSEAAVRSRVVVLAKYYYPFNGGIENATRVLCEGMAQSHDVKVIAFNNGPGHAREIITGVEVERHAVFRVIKSQPLSLSYFLAVLRHRADVTHFHAPNVLASLALALRPARRTIVVHHMDIYGRENLRRVARRLYDSVLRRARLLVVTSLKNADVSADLRVKVPTRAVPLGIDPAAYAVDEALRVEARAWRRKLSCDRPLVGFLGRHVRYKGLDVLLDAMVQISDVHLVVAGDGPQHEDAKAQAKRLMISDRVHFLGEISHRDKLKLLTAIDVFAFPSTEITEAFGISQLEAMLLGTAVVASDLPTGVSDVSRNNDTALTVRPSDPIALATALDRMIKDHPLRERLAAAARERVLREFTTFAMMRRFNEINDAVLKDRLSTNADPARGVNLH